MPSPSRRLFAVLALAAALFSRPAAATVPPPTFALPPDFYPESLAVGPDGSFYIGSWRQGAIARLRPGETTARTFVPPGRNGLTNVQGLLVDAARGRLWACSGDVGYSLAPRRPSALKAFDLATGRARGSYPLPGGGHCNDLALGPHGRIFVTDSFHPRILVLDGPDGALQPWIEDASFTRGPQGYALNGLAIDPRGVVYAATVAASDTLVRIPIRADGTAGLVTRIALPRVLKNADGLRFLRPDVLLIFESNAFAKDDPLDGAVSMAHLDNAGHASLLTIANGLADPSSGVAYAGRVYILETRYEILFRAPPDQPAAAPAHVPFTVVSVPLPTARAP